MFYKYRRAVAVLLTAVLVFTAFPFSGYAASFPSATHIANGNVGDQVLVSYVSNGQSKWYKVTASAGQWIYCALYNMVGGNWDLKLYRPDNSNTPVAVSTKTGDSIEYIGYTAPINGDYYFEVRGTAITGTGAYCYFKPVLAGGVQGTSSTNSGYSRYEAKDYIESYWNARNTLYPNFNHSDYGGDCANYTSQVLYWGGLAKLGSSDRMNSAHWYMDTGLGETWSWTHDNYSVTWAQANSFSRHWGTDSTGNGYRRGYECKYYIGQDIVDNFDTLMSTLKTGDIVQWTSNDYTTRTHNLVVYERNNENGFDIILSAHSDDAGDEPNPVDGTKSVSLKAWAAANTDKMIAITRIRSGG